jgi:hypothetical protein
VDFELRDAGAGKGLGYFALRDFAVGEKVLVERPVMHIRPDHDGYRNRGSALFEMPVDTICCQYAGLPNGARAAVSALHVAEKDADFEKPPFQQPFIMQVQGQPFDPRKFTQNAVNLDGGLGVGLFIHGSRFNHACIPNCLRSYVKQHGLMVFSTCKPIAAGEEMTRSYVGFDFHFGRMAEYHDFCMQGWGFQCSCPACSDPAFFPKLSTIENMQNEIASLKHFKSIGQLTRIMELREQMFMFLDQIDSHFCPTFKIKHYKLQFELALMRRSTSTIASHCAAKHLELLEQEIGGSTIEPREISEARLMVEHPERNEYYMIADRAFANHQRDRVILVQDSDLFAFAANYLGNL